MPIGLVVLPLGWALLSTVIRWFGGLDTAVLLNQGVQMLLAKHVGVACLTLPLLLFWTDGGGERAGMPGLVTLVLMAAGLLLMSWALNWVIANGFDGWLLHLHDYRLTVGAALAAVILALPARWSMPLLATTQFVMLYVLVANANQAQGIGDIWWLVTHVVELSVLSLLLVSMYLVDRDRRAAFASIEEAADHDASTGLPNANALRRAWTKRGEVPAEIRFLCFDHVDMLVGSYGWPALQAMLRSVERKLVGQVGVYHLGGAQFVLLPDEHAVPDWAGLLEGLQRHSFGAAGTRLRVAPYLGLAKPKALSTVALEEAIADAGEAFTQARRRGETDPVPAVDASGHEAPAIARRRRFNAAVGAIDQVRAGNIALHLHLQRIVRIDGNRDDGVSGEVLCRLRGANGALLMPDQFIPVLESSANVAELDLAVLEALFAHLRQHPDFCRAARRLCINVSGASLSSDSFRSRLTTMLRDAPVAPSVLCFELTETAMIARQEQALHLFDELRELGCTMALDDFGSGMQNFSRLKQLPVDMIKIDGQFVRQAWQRRSDYEIVRAAVSVARAHGLTTVAEHVEDAATDRCMRELGVEWGQGYFYSRPVPLADVDLEDASGKRLVNA